MNIAQVFEQLEKDKLQKGLVYRDIAKKAGYNPVTINKLFLYEDRRLTGSFGMIQDVCRAMGYRLDFNLVKLDE